MSGQLDFSYVVNGRFKGGWITRHYGRPRDNVHAVQMELALRGYMTETPPWTYLDEVANRTRKVLRQALEAMITAGERLDGVGT